MITKKFIRLNLIKKIDLIVFVLLGLLAVLYGTFSYPWPRTVGWAEVLVGVGLLLLVGINGVAIGLDWKEIKNQVPNIPINISFIFVYILIVPLITGMTYGWQMADVIRDVIPLMYMFLPLLAGHLFIQSATLWRERISFLAGIVGVLFSVRFFLYPQTLTGNLFYFPQAPEVLFGAVYWLLKGLRSPLKSLSTWFYFIMGITCFTATLLFIQRAEVGLIIIAILIMTILSKQVRKRIIAFLLITGCILLFIGLFSDFGPKLFSVVVTQLTNLVRKTRITGFNGKDLEMLGVVKTVMQNNFLFGVGWGSLFFSPILNDSEVRFTHSWLTYMFLKSGVIGLILILGYIFWLTKPILNRLIKYSIKDEIILPSLLGGCVVLLQGILFQTIYKTLGFGFILLILFLICFHEKENNLEGSKPGL